MNSGMGLSPRRLNGRRGVGLRNIEARLKLHYGADASLQVAEFNERNVHVTIVLPLQFSSEEETSLTRLGIR
jgi:sensor histidine kinase YesM